ncbi:hypothetical protein PSECIP111951_04186 [Pseudoalteromonas holothuriae]|uniref:Uncharacterized protein n=2 Tax=Pseudoalteromonas holothuriae TaxID=2963714 RepID=A0ABN8UVP6_9GAMM|nr:hypothetical protein PSECIP111951_04186 [Pseudoalteromonas sp. CIP111951]
MNPITGIVNSGVRYGADKLFGNQASWNFGNVAVDAFGNAIGNSIVSGLSREPRISKADQNKINRGAEKLSQNVNQALDRKLKTPISIDTPKVLLEGLNLEVGDYRHLRNPNERVEELNRLNENLNQDLEIRIADLQKVQT